jgi:hypothetical protein
MTGMWPDLLHTVPVPVADITAGDVVYFAGWREEFRPAMTKLIAVGVIVVTAPPPWRVVRDSITDELPNWQ